MVLLFQLGLLISNHVLAFQQGSPSGRSVAATGTTKNHHGSFSLGRHDELLHHLTTITSTVQPRKFSRGVVVAALGSHQNSDDDDGSLEQQWAELKRMMDDLDGVMKNGTSSPALLFSQIDLERDADQTIKAYELAKSSISRLDKIRQELAALESALDRLEDQSAPAGRVSGNKITTTTTRSTSSETKATPQQPWTPHRTARGLGTASSSSSSNSFSTMEQLAKQWAAMNTERKLNQGSSAGLMPPLFDRPIGPTAKVAVTSASPSPLYQERSTKVAEAAALGKSRWGVMENQKAQLNNNEISGVPSSAGMTATTVTPSLHYRDRNNRVAQAAGAGMSRWGVMENEKAGHQQSMGAHSAVARSAPATLLNNNLYQDRTKQVARAADAGMSRWGSTENRKAQQMANGHTKDDLFQDRNNKVAQAAAAGKSRWGVMENEKAISGQAPNIPLTTTTTTTTSSPSSSPTSSKSMDQLAREWAARANSKNPTGHTQSQPQNAIGTSPDDSLYYDRARKVAEAADAGKSRWGVMENVKAQQMAEGVASHSTTMDQISYGVDGVGLRNDVHQEPPQVTRINGAGLANVMGQLGKEWATMNNDKNGFVVPGPRQSHAQPSTGMPSSYYLDRSRKVAQATDAGQSRWGAMENMKAQQMAEGVMTPHLSWPQISAVLSSVGFGVNGRRGPPGATTGQAGSSSGTTVPLVQGPTTDRRQSQPPSSTGASSMPTYYYDRTKKVAQAADTGKSRWGVMENVKAQVLADSSMGSSPSNSHYYDRTMKVAQAADAGQSRWGFMENIKAQNMAEGIVTPTINGYHTSMGSDVHQDPSVTTSIPSRTSSTSMNQLAQEWAAMTRSEVARPQASTETSPMPSHYYDRTLKVAEAANLGKSRWGVMETTKAQQMAEGAMTQSGLSQSRAELSVQKSHMDNYYDDRSRKVAQAADTGRSRWGAVENLKAQQMAEGVTTSYLNWGQISNVFNKMGMGDDNNSRSLDSAIPMTTTQHAPVSVSQAHSVSMDRLAQEWAAINKERAPSSPQSPPTLTQPLKPISAETLSAQASTPVAPQMSQGFSASMDQLAREWAAMNQSKNLVQPQSHPPQPTTSQTSIPVAPSSSRGNSISLDQLAREWGAMNNEKVASQSPPLQPHTAQRQEHGLSVMEQLALEWSKVNKSKE